MVKLKQIVAALMLSLLTAISYTPTVLAAVANSTNYGVSEVQFGSGGELRACSTAYCSKQSAGELTVGNTKSTNYQAQGGFNTNREPFLEVAVTGGVLDLGVLSAFTTSSASTSFSVKSYLASGYVVTIAGEAPTNKTGYVVASMSTAGTSQIGQEQFGINLRQNTTPAVGADAIQVPSTTFSFGAASTGYGTANSFKFVPGDQIASSPSSSGQTNYTLSMITNIGTLTPTGAFKGQLSINVVPTF